MGLWLIRIGIHGAVFVRLWENGSKRKEWGTESAAGQNRSHGVWRLGHAAEHFATGYLHCLLFPNTDVPVIASWHSTKRRGYPCLYEQCCRYNRPLLLKHRLNSQANKISSHCVTHLVFLAILSTIGVSLHHCQSALAVKGCSSWSNRALCCMQPLFLPLSRREFMFEPYSFWPETWLHLRGQSQRLRAQSMR